MTSKNINKVSEEGFRATLGTLSQKSGFRRIVGAWVVQQRLAFCARVREVEMHECSEEVGDQHPFYL